MKFRPILSTPSRRQLEDLVGLDPEGNLVMASAPGHGLLLATLKLNTLPTIGGGGKLFVHTCSIHYQSTNMATKNKAPNFWA